MVRAWGFRWGDYSHSEVAGEPAALSRAMAEKNPFLFSTSDPLSSKGVDSPNTANGIALGPVNNGIFADGRAGHCHASPRQRREVPTVQNRTPPGERGI